MSEAAELLSQLREVRLPDPPVEVSIVPGALSATVIIMALLTLAIVWWKRRHRWITFVERELTNYQTMRPDVALCEMAKLLKRIVMTHKSKPSISTLSGDDWLDELDSFFSTDFFTAGEGRLFGRSLYQSPIPDTNSNRDLITDLSQSIGKLVKRRRWRW